MRADSRSAALGAVSRRAARITNPRIEITPSVAQYRQLCRDLAALRKRGAPSHTAAILEAVHAAAAGKLAHVQHENAGQR